MKKYDYFCNPEIIRIYSGNYLELFRNVPDNKYCEIICSTSPPGGNQVDGLPPASSITVRLSWNSFFTLENIILIWIAYLKPQIYEMNISKSWDIDRNFDKNFDEKWWKNDWSRIDPELFQDGPGISRTMKKHIWMTCRLICTNCILTIYFKW